MRASVSSTILTQTLLQAQFHQHLKGSAIS